MLGLGADAAVPDLTVDNSQLFLGKKTKNKKTPMRALVRAAALLLMLGLGADAAVPDLTVDNFDTTLSGKSGVWVLDFYAPWCGSRTHPPTHAKRGREREAVGQRACAIGHACVTYWH